MSMNDMQEQNDMEPIDPDEILGKEFRMGDVTDKSMERTVWLTIRAMHKAFDTTDMATARLALEVAKRIDRDGDTCGVSLYNRLHSLLLDLQGKGYSSQCPFAPQSQSATS